jgi:hypothetical protein
MSILNVCIIPMQSSAKCPQSWIRFEKVDALLVGFLSVGYYLGCAVGNLGSRTYTDSVAFVCAGGNA